jgi:hypothetical protein
MLMPQKRSARKVQEKAEKQPEFKDNVTKLDASESDIAHVRRVVAGNPNTPLTVLSRLAEEGCDRIRRCVAENPKTPVELLKKLSYDDSSEVRLAVAENPHTLPGVLTTLSEDSSVDVRYGVAENPHMPEDILLKLSRDENPYVRCRALKTVQMLPAAVQSRLRFLLQEPSELSGR